MIYLFVSWTDCGVKFSAKSSLYVHLKKHSKPKSATGDKVVYHCPIEKCTRTYTCKSSLRQHMLKFHTPVLGKWHCIMMTIWHNMAVVAKESYIVEEWKTNLMSLAILFHFLCAQHVSDINISIIRSLRLCWWITTSVVLFSVRRVLELWWGRF